MKPGYFLLPILVVLLIVASCKKSNTGTHPKISLESINTQVKPEDSMVAIFKFDNAGGTLGTGTFYSIRIRLNENQAQNIGGPDTLTNFIPDFGKASLGEFRYVLNWKDYLSTASPWNDTLQFKFYAMTPDSLYTDTIVSPKIIVLTQ